MLDDFLIRAALAAVGVALVAGPLGCFVAWRRMAYFGDAVSHAALLGVALGLAADLPIVWGALTSSGALALSVGWLARRETLGVDSLLGVFAHAGLALGVLAITMLPNRPAVDLESYLFGDILAVDRADLLVIWIGAASAVGLLAWRWADLLNATLSAPLATAEGRSPEIARFVLMGAVALLVAIALQVVGALLVVSLLILPAAAARPLARSPEAMAVAAAALGVVGAVAGIAGSVALDAPTGPMIVVALFGLFVATALGAALAAPVRAALHRNGIG